LARTIWILAAAIALLLAGEAQAAERRVVLVTLDGMPWQEVFRGADPVRAADRAFVSELVETRKDFLDPPERARAVMPFLHDVVGKQGVLLGDRDHGGCMAVANDQWFSYPGYNEMLTGKPDPAIRSNDHGPNKNVTVLEWLNTQPGLKGRVQAFGSWAAFHDILGAGRGSLPVDAGWDAKSGPLLARLQAEVPRLWPAERFDAFTHVLALQALRKAKPRVLYVAYGDTDEFAHEGRYDQMLWAARRSDGFLAELWKTLQADPAYAGRTTLIVTTDHGRGVGTRESWRHHGRGVFPQSNETWLAALGPEVAPGKSAVPGPCASTAQVAATVLRALGLDWRAFDPTAAAPLDIFRQ
jgi:hypothetical protein